MNNFLKCWLFILCLLFIFLIILTDRVNASTYTSYWLGNNNSIFNKTLSLNDDVVNYDFIFDSPVSVPSTTNRIIGQLWGVYKNTTITSNVNINLTCNNTDYTTQPFLATITYADGTQANILYSEYTEFCGQFIGQNSQNYMSYENVNNDFQVIVSMFNSTGTTEIGTCEVISNNFYCPWDNRNSSLGGFRFKVFRKVSNIHNFRLGFGAIINFEIDDASQIISNNNTNTQSIINNQNQNAQQQHQDSQTINNSITSNDVTGNNSSSSIASIGNTFNTQEDFLLNLLTIPYTLWTSILNVFSNTCAPLDVGTIFNYHLVFPCIELNQFLGGIYATIIDVIFTAIIYSAFIRRVIKYFRELLTLDEHALITGGVKIW